MRRRPLLHWLGVLPATSWFGTRAAALDIDSGVSAERSLAFPRDFGAHPETQIEWWYITGALEVPQLSAANAQPLYGFQVTFFRSRTQVSAAHPSRFAATQLIFAHAALTDLRQGRLRHDQRLARSGFDIASADTLDTHLALRGWRLERTGTREQSRYLAQLGSDAGGFRFDFRLDSTQPLLLQGEAGYSRKGPDPQQASHYYSQPQLDVQGTLTLDGQPQLARGRAWLDHEWSDSLLPAAAVGWDWVGMNLADGSALTAFRLRRVDATTVYAGGSFRPASGPTRNFAPGEVRFAPGRLWTSPASRAVYPVEWTLQTPAGRFVVKTLLDNQELDSRASTGAIYWEGLSELVDEGGRRVGLGYLEMTGYAARLRL